MDGTQDSTDTTSGGDEGADLDPQEAVALIRQTRRQAEREFNPRPPLLTFFLALVALFGYGSLWLSVLGQHPYKGPQGWAIGIVYAMVALVVVLALANTHRANEGIGKKRPLRSRMAAVAVGTAWVAVYVYQGAMYHAGVSDAVGYGIYPATAPLMVLGVVGAAISAMREEWLYFAGALGIACVAAIAAYTGPVAAWLVMGIALFAVLMANSAVRVIMRRA
jgi:hypothetical protein